MDETKKKAMELLARAHRERSPYSRKAGVLEKGMVHPDDESAMSAIIAALSAAPQVPESVEPTPQMIQAGMRWLTNFQHMRAGDKHSALAEAFKAMLAAKPEPMA